MMDKDSAASHEYTPLQAAGPEDLGVYRSIARSYTITEGQELHCVINDLCDQVRERDAEIERLRDELAASQKLAADRLEQQRQMGADLTEIERLRMEKDAKFYTALAASQAREKVRVEALEKVLSWIDAWGYTGPETGFGPVERAADAALDLPTDDTALRETLARAQEEMRERCAVAAWMAGMAYHNRVLGMPTDAREVGSSAASDIRKLEVK